MGIAEHERLTINLADGENVSALLTRPAATRAGYVLAHGAGAGMTHPFLCAAAEALAARDIATLRYQFPYMERGSRRPDSPKTAHAAVRAAVAAASKRLPGVSLFAGGKSFGGRMTSQAQAAERLPNVRGLAFLGFPLHGPNKPSTQRAEHLQQVHVPLLFLQGTRDKLADLSLLEPIVTRLGERATLRRIEGADHGFHVLKRSGRTDDDALREMVDGLADWLTTHSE